MAFSSRSINTDPLRAFKYNVVIPIKLTQPGNSGGTTGTPGGMSRLGFMMAAGLGLAIEPLTYREGGDNLTPRKMPGQADFNPITLTRGLFPQDNDAWLWIQALFTAMYGDGVANPVFSGRVLNGNPGTALGAPDFRTQMYINILQHPNTTPQALKNSVVYNGSWPQQNSIVKVSVKLYSAWIGTWALSDFDAGGNAVAVEQMSINYEGFDVRYAGSGYIANPTGW